MPIPSDPSTSWKELVAAALQEAGGEAHLSQLNALIDGHPKTKTNPTWRDTIRRVVRQYSIFQPVPPERSGTYRYVGGQIAAPPSNVALPDASPNESHGVMQGLLASLGNLYGYDTYIPAGDRTSRSLNGIALRHFATLDHLDDVTPDPATRRRLEQIDVLWTSEDSDGVPWPLYAFEVEHTTGIRSGLERLRTLPRRFQTRMYIVARGDRERPRFDRYVQEPNHRHLSPAISFLDYDAVREVHTLAAQHDDLRSDLGLEYRSQHRAW